MSSTVPEKLDPIKARTNLINYKFTRFKLGDDAIRIQSHLTQKLRVACSKKLLRTFGPDGTKRLCDIVIRDETCIKYLYGIPNKWSNQMWVGENEPRPLVLRPGYYY